MATAQSTLPTETLKAFLVVGVIFPLHVILGVLSVPTIVYQLLVAQSALAWAFLLLYLPFFLYPAQSRFPGWRGFDKMWSFFDYTTSCSNYFGTFEVRSSVPFDPLGQYFIASHPHGTLIFQRMFWRCSLTDGLFHRPLRMLGASVLFRIPIVREMSLLFGAVDAGRTNCEHLLQQGSSVIVYPGGIDEMPLSGDGPKSDVRVRTRTGFIRIAVTHGVPVLPTFCFGELEAVSAVSPLPASLAKWLQKTLRVSTTMFVGRLNLFLPRRVPFVLCIGAPIQTTRCTDPAAVDVEVARVHAIYKQALRDLYSANQETCGYGGRGLVFQCEEMDTQRQKRGKSD
mmetsp:Transcript_28788/g.73905  ORF Transcript_28788/g.73905 Transcript_28788/m.73905 type:complete len:341 (-) Transcript_28788:340-1362(-)